MIITVAEYHEIVKQCRRLVDTFQLPTTQLCDQYHLDFDAITSICSHLHIRQTKKLLPLIEQDIHRIGQRVDDGELLIDIAKEKKFSPYKLAKMYAEQFLPPGFKLSRLLNDFNSYQIDNPRLVSDLIRCCMEDPYLSNLSDSLKKCIGDEYEELLYNLLREYGLCFETEAELRLQGKPKTPDVLLLFPMGVKINSNDEWQIIHWIDSKAIFGDMYTLEQNSEQLQGYVNRYGRGLVIFWHGYVDVVATQSSIVLISDRFPTEWLFPGS